MGSSSPSGSPRSCLPRRGSSCRGRAERDYLRRAMQAGAREYLIKPFSHDELVAAIRRVHQLEEKKGTFARAAAPDNSGQRRASSLGEVIVLFSGKGGVGKTRLATNLSVALAVETERLVASRV